MSQKRISKKNKYNFTKERRLKFFLFVFCSLIIVILTVCIILFNKPASPDLIQAEDEAPKVIYLWADAQATDKNTDALSSAGAFSDLSITEADIQIITADSLDSIPDYDSETESEYEMLAIANVDNYVNVRALPNTDSDIVGKIYDGAVAQIDEYAGDDNDWLKIHSGNVNGYIKAEYFIYGKDAADVAENYVTKYATINCDRLNVREKASPNSSRIGYLESNEKIAIDEFVSDNEWLKVTYLDTITGYISAEYVNITEEFTYARTVEEDNAIKKAAEELLARNQDKTEDKKENLTPSKAQTSTNVNAAPPTAYSTNSELRGSIVAYASQFLGNKYVSGGNSLETGTDCSGFTSLIYAQYGYGLSRTPQGQYTSGGRSIDINQIQPGDVVCYSSNGSKCTHVGIYIGNGKIIHSSTPKRGVVTDSITACGPVLAVKNIID